MAVYLNMLEVIRLNLVVKYFLSISFKSSHFGPVHVSFRRGAIEDRW